MQSMSTLGTKAVLYLFLSGHLSATTMSLRLPLLFGILH
jgi:hypothetical protein